MVMTADEIWQRTTRINTKFDVVNSILRHNEGLSMTQIQNSGGGSHTAINKIIRSLEADGFIEKFKYNSHYRFRVVPEKRSSLLLLLESIRDNR